MIGKTISHYKILEKLGEGGMGEVFLAQDTKLNRKVALKFLPVQLASDGDLKERFKREAQAAAALNHPNIITIHEVAEYETRPFIAMEYVEGESLKDLIARKELSIGEVLDFALQISDGLAVARQAGVVHRDIKPQNILMGKDGRVRICDFGLAKVRKDVTLTQAGSTLGTVAYMSPEQAQGKEADNRSDIFSFGVVLYEMITNQLPFKGEHDAAVMNSIVNDSPEPLARYKANVPGGLQRIVEKALAKDKTERYQHADDLLADLRREKRNLEHSKTVQVPSEKAEARPRKKFLSFVVPASIIFIIVLLFLILKPFQVEIAPEKAAVADENSLAIMYFENMVDKDDPERLGEIVTNLLITDLSESEYMNVVSSQRLYDILKLLGREGEKVIDRSVATEVATKARAKWMLLGSILQVEPEIILTSQLVDVATGKVAASQRIDGEAGEKIFPMVDKLTVEVKNDLSLPAAAKNEPDRPVADVTTHSPEAYRYYLEGVDHYYKYYSAEAGTSFERALSFDSTFAMAYFWLSIVRGEQGRPREQRELIAKALEYSDKVNWKEERYIKSMQAQISGDNDQAIEELQNITERYPEDKEAFFWLGIIHWSWLGEREETIRQLTRAIEIDPLYKFPYNVLAYAYNDIGDFEKSIWAINKYISLAPDEANPYDSRGDLYAYNGRLGQAIDSYRKALEIRPGFYRSLDKLGHMYLFQREYAQAESSYKELASSSDKHTRSRARTYLALIPMYQGQFDRALRILGDGIAADRMEEVETEQDNKHFLKAAIFEAKNHLNSALKEAERAIEISHSVTPDAVPNWRHYYVLLLAENGDFEKAEKVAEALKRDTEEKQPALMPYCWWASGCIEFSRGNFEVSLADFEKAAEAVTNFYADFMVAKAYLGSGKLGEAVAVLEKTLSRYDETRANVPISAVKAYYLLGMAYEESGWDKKAMDKYGEFLEIWKDADPGIPEVEDAKQRLKALKVQS